MHRSRGPSLADRSARAAGGDAAAPATRHCWADPPGHPGPWCGLVVEWRRAGSAWEGRCIYVIDDVDGTGSRVVERWLPAHCLRPIDSGRRPG